MSEITSEKRKEFMQRHIAKRIKDGTYIMTCEVCKKTYKYHGAAHHRNSVYHKRYVESLNMHTALI